MNTVDPGNYWKTPFVWEPGAPGPDASSPLRFEPADERWLEAAAAQVMSDSMDESDRFAVALRGASRAVEELMAIFPKYFERREGWWSAGIDAAGQKAGFVLPDEPMVRAFRRTGYQERERWQRPLA